MKTKTTRLLMFANDLVVCCSASAFQQWQFMCDNSRHPEPTVRRACLMLLAQAYERWVGKFQATVHLKCSVLLFGRRRHGPSRRLSKLEVFA